MGKAAQRPAHTTRYIIVIILFGGLLLAGVTTWSFTHPKYPKPESQAIREQVGKLVMLPPGEEPAIATIGEGTQPTDRLLEKSQAGDKLLLYYGSLKAYLYRPSLNKLVDIGPLTVDPSATEVQGTRITVVDGANMPDKAADYRTRLRSIFKDAAVIAPPQTAARSDHSRTVIVDLTNNQAKYNLVSNIAATLRVSQGVLPLGETAPADADILIVVGKD